MDTIERLNCNYYKGGAWSMGGPRDAVAHRRWYRAEEAVALDGKMAGYFRCPEPTCNEVLWVSTIKTVTNQTRCGTACAGAVSAVCKCACGGANHGL